MDWLIPGVTPLLVALCPAAFTWWWWRHSFAHAADASVLPERLASFRQTVNQVAAVCGAALFLRWPASAPWALLLLVLSQMMAAFPMRKTLFEESWTLRTYLSHRVRMIVALMGFWILMAVTPWIAGQAGRPGWILACSLGTVLIAWSEAYVFVARAVLPARPITDPRLTRRFDTLVASAGLPTPRFEFVAMRGGVLANAFALPSLYRSSVVFTDTLLSRLSEDEVVGICAHELAHLEYYDRRRLRRARVATWAMILIAAALAPVSLAFRVDIPFPVWPGVLLVGFVLRSKTRKRNETLSDLRAVALTGDPDALASALTKLHAIAHLPRRWSRDREAQATHPSLARRIRDIRASVGEVPAPLTEPQTFQAPDGVTAVTFSPTQVEWIQPLDRRHAVPYGSLVDLRLHASSLGTAALIAVARDAHKWRMSVRPEDVNAIQRVLDLVDDKLTRDQRVPAIGSPVTRLASVTIAGLALMLGNAAFALTAFAAALAPDRSLLFGAGAAGLASAGLILLDGASGPDPVFSGFCAGLAAALVALGWVRRTQPVRAGMWLFGCVAVTGALAVAAVGARGLDPVQLHRATQSDRAAFVLLAGIAVSGWTLHTRASRATAAAAVLTCLSLCVLRSSTFLNLVARDPLLISGPSATRGSVNPTPIAAFDVPVNVEEVSVSPSGRLAAIVPEFDGEDERAKTPKAFQITGAGQSFGSVRADDLVFVDDSRALALVITGPSAELQDIDVASRRVLWRQPVPVLTWGQVAYQSRTGRWSVLGGEGRNTSVRATGTIDTTGVQETTWPSGHVRGGWIEGFGASDRAMLEVQNHSRPPFFKWNRFLEDMAVLSQSQFRSDVWLVRDGIRRLVAHSELEVSCADGMLEDAGVVCAAYDGTRTRILAIDPATGSRSALVTVSGRFNAERLSSNEWLVGVSKDGPVAIHLRDRREIDPWRFDEMAYAATATQNVLATVSWRGRGSIVRIYSLNQ